LVVVELSLAAELSALAAPVEASASALTRAQNSINDCADLRAEQSANLQQWLSSGSSGQM